MFITPLRDGTNLREKWRVWLRISDVRCEDERRVGEERELSARMVPFSWLLAGVRGLPRPGRGT